MTSLVRLTRGHLLRDHGHRERKKDRDGIRREMGKFLPWKKKSGALIHVQCDTKRHIRIQARDTYISGEVAESWPAKRERGEQHLHAKSVGEAAADIGEHAPDFRPYPSTIDRADKIPRLRAREAVDGEEAEDATKNE